MTLTVREGGIAPPVLVTHTATSMELRDSTGKLLFLLLMIPSDKQSEAQSFLTANCNEPGFADTAKGLGFTP